MSELWNTLHSITQYQRVKSGQSVSPLPLFQDPRSSGSLAEPPDLLCSAHLAPVSPVPWPVHLLVLAEELLFSQISASHPAQVAAPLKNMYFYIYSCSVDS